MIHLFLFFLLNHLAFQIVLLVLLIGIVIGIFVGKKIWDKNRKKRANELIDDYDYESPNKDTQNRIIN